jgi:four helix bundle protein
MDLADTLYDVTESEPFRGRYSLRDQMERAALSVSSNIAEGFERGTRDELLAFLYIARGSCGELRSQLAFCSRRKLVSNAAHAELRKLCLSVSKQLGAFAAYLRDRDWKGQRDFTAREKAAREAEEQRAQFMRQLEEITRKAREKRLSNAQPPESTPSSGSHGE